MPYLPHKLITILARLGRYARDRIAIDTRTLAVFRIAAGVLILADVFARTSRFSEFYTEDGLVPQAVARDFADGWLFSVFLISANPYFTAGLFVLHALVAVQLIIGYRTTFATVLSFLFVISLDNRNPLVLSYADTLFRLLLFWAIFLPLGERWSVDAVHRERVPRTKVANIASAAILLQMFFMYFGNAIQKAAGEHWRSGEATPLVFGLDHITWALAPSLQAFPTLLVIGGWIWFAMLMLFSWQLILAPGRLRMVFVAAFILVHASFAVTVRIGAFPYVAIAGVLLFLQTPFWDDVRRALAVMGVHNLAPLRARLIAIAERFPRFAPMISAPRHVVNAGFYSLASLAVLTVLVLPPMAFLQSNELISLEVSQVERPLSTGARALAVNQPPWSIFAPNPITDDAYYVFAAGSQEGEFYDLFNERTLIYERPEGKLHRQFKHYRERFYMEDIEREAGREHPQIAQALGVYLCTHWEHVRGITLTQIDMYVVREQVTIETISNPDQRERTTELLYQHGCNGEVSGEVARPDF